MAQSRRKTPQREPLPGNFGSLQEFWAFWDAHSTADYEDLMEDVDVRVDILTRRTYCAVAEDLMTQLRAEALLQGVSTETLINLWLRVILAVLQAERMGVSTETLINLWLRMKTTG